MVCGYICVKILSAWQSFVCIWAVCQWEDRWCKGHGTWRSIHWHGKGKLVAVFLVGFTEMWFLLHATTVHCYLCLHIVFNIIADIM